MFLAGSGRAKACSLCGCGDPLLAASDPAAITGKLRLQIDTEYIRVDAGTENQPGFTDQLTQWAYHFNAVYRPISRLSLMAVLPILDKSIRTEGPNIDQSDSNLAGLGDFELLGRYAVWRRLSLVDRRVQEVAFSLGSALPTGSNDAKTRDATGTVVPVDPHGQLGTGGFGPLVGLHYRFEQADWLAFADVSYRFRTQGSYFDGSKYKFGYAALWSLHGQYRVLVPLAVDLGIDGRYAFADRSTDPNGVADDSVVNTGGTVISAAPGIYCNAVGSLWLFARAQIPVYQHLHGQQDVKASFAMGLQYQVL